MCVLYARKLQGILRSMSSGLLFCPTCLPLCGQASHAEDHFTSGGGGITDHIWGVKLRDRKGMVKR